MEYSAVSAKAKRVQVFQPQPALQCYAVSADLRGRIRRSGERASSMASLKDKCACCTKETRRANCEALVNSRKEQGQDPDDYFILLQQRRARLAENGEVISDDSFEDIMLRCITSDYDCILSTSYRDPNFGLKDTQSTMRRMYIDDLSRNDKPKVADLGRPCQLVTPSPPPKVNFGVSTVTNPDTASRSALILRMRHRYPLQRVVPRPNGAPSNGQLPTVTPNAVRKISGARSTD